WPLACECDARGRPGFGAATYPQRERLLAVLATAAAVPTDAVAKAAQQSGATGPKIGEAIHRARVEAVAASLPART
ncbi:multifunctional CCA tRNA nucleotidyl transferase/2'3'-cyclic phosphodiesterase/2'nucleotidase/phosphatase, partial [Variovorax sp. Varisp62]